MEEKFEEIILFDKNEGRLVDAGLIAIILVIVQIWISSGVHDISSLVSLIAFAISLPMLAVDLLIMHHSRLFSKIDDYLDDLSSSTSHQPVSPYNKSQKVNVVLNVNRTTGMTIAAIGIISAIWHASWVAGLIFLIIGIISWTIYIEVSPNTEDLLKVAGELGYKHGYDLGKEENKKEEEYLKDLYYFD